VVKYLNKARVTLLVCVFTITNNRLADALRRAHDRGVSVRVISDDECTKMLGSDVTQLGEYGIPFRIDPNPHAHMHHKFAVIDDDILMTGSFNWTSQAVNKNQENLAVLDDEGLIRCYKEEFEKLWKEFEGVQAPVVERPAKKKS